MACSTGDLCTELCGLAFTLVLASVLWIPLQWILLLLWLVQTSALSLLPRLEWILLQQQENIFCNGGEQTQIGLLFGYVFAPGASERWYELLYTAASGAACTKTGS